MMKRLATTALAGFWAVLAQFQCAATTQDVTAFGAIPDDNKDDAAAIQKAIDAAGSGDTLSLPAGTFLVDRVLRAKSGVKIRGAGQGKTIIKCNASGQIDFFDLSGTRHVELSDFTIEGNGDSNAHDGVFAKTGGGHFIHRLAIQNLGSLSGPLGIHFVGTDGNYSNGVSDCVIADNTIRNIGVKSEWGGGIRLSWGSSRNQVLRNVVDSTGRGGIFANDGSMDLVIRGNVVTRSGRKQEKLGIELWGNCDRGVVEDNRIDHWLSLSGCSLVAARRNIISDTSGGIGFIGLEIIAQDAVVTDNLVDGGQQMGVSVSNDAHNERQYCAYNTIRNMIQWGAQLQGDRTGARLLYYYRNRFLTTQRGNKAAIYPGADGRGFRFNGNCQGVTLDSNEISHNPAEGLELGGSGLDQISVVNNTISGNGFDAVRGDAGGDLEWTGNTVAGNGSNNQLRSRGFPQPKPAAEFSCPAAALTGQAVDFANASSAAGGGIAHVLWDFGEGVPSARFNDTHTYSRAGTYRVTLVVWDSHLRGAIQERSITISEKSKSAF
ncbi:MAG: right-handed parallel beta-helix repeat-containing protein [Limisphaerales bacterium]